jgi:hypothetical protein
MIRRLSTWLVLALAATALAAGCGSSSKSSTTTATTSTPAAGNPGAGGTTARTPTTAAGGAGATGTVPKEAPKVNGAVAVAQCKRAVQAQTTLSAEQRAKLEATCSHAATGSQAALEKIASEVCLALAKSAHLPAGVSREQALAVCKPR